VGNSQATWICAVSICRITLGWPEPTIDIELVQILCPTPSHSTTQVVVSSTPERFSKDIRVEIPLGGFLPLLSGFWCIKSIV
jgi:hypothetical protein